MEGEAIGMKIDRFTFGSIRIDGEIYEQDVVIDRGEVKPRKKKPSKRYRDEFGHTPLSLEEKIPWKCRMLVIGTGAEGSLPIMPQVLEEAERRGVEVMAKATGEAIKVLASAKDETNAILHITC